MSSYTQTALTQAQAAYLEVKWLLALFMGTVKVASGLSLQNAAVLTVALRRRKKFPSGICMHGFLRVQTVIG